jgi:hypothetical protein
MIDGSSSPDIASGVAIEAAEIKVTPQRTAGETVSALGKLAREQVERVRDIQTDEIESPESQRAADITKRATEGVLAEMRRHLRRSSARTVRPRNI